MMYRISKIYSKTLSGYCNLYAWQNATELH